MMQKFWAGLLFFVALVSAWAGTAPEPCLAANGIDTIVVCPTALREALQPWVEFRRSQGHQLAFAQHSPVATEVRREIRRLAAGQAVRWILLVGDAPQQGALTLSRTATTTFYEPARVISKWGPDREIASDNAFADLDDDGVPDAAIGRLTADSPHDLTVMVQKIIHFETSALGAISRHRVHLVAGVGGFGSLVDGAIEGITKKFVTEEIPATYGTTMTYGSWRSPFCPDPRRFHDVAVDRFNEGGLFWVYIGHGQRLSLDQLRVPGGTFHILDVNDMNKLQCQDSSPIAVFLACYTGAFDSQRDCLAEEMLRAEGGPVSVVSGSRLTMPYAMAVMSSAMMYECFREQRETLGEVMLHAKRSMVQKIDDPADPRYAQRMLLDTLASLITLNANESVLLDERREHVALFHILGDPLLRIARPIPIHIDASPEVNAGDELRLTIRSPLAGLCTLELACRRDQSKTPLAARVKYDGSERGLAAIQQAYDQANDCNWHSTTIELPGKALATRIPIPADARGPCILRAYVAGARGDALGATALTIVPKQR